MAVETLHTGSETPVGDFSDGSPGIVTALVMVFAVNGTVSDIGFRIGSSTGSGTYTSNAWQLTSSTTGTLLVSKVFGGSPTINARNWTTLDSPLAVTAGVPYVFGTHSSAGRYVLTNNVFNGSSLVSGNITAPASGTTVSGIVIKQGCFEVNATATVFPDLEGSKADYFADVKFTADTGGAISPTGIAVGAALGSTALSQAFTVLPNGLAVPVALGTPTVSQSLSIAPTGIAVPVGKGTPTVSQAMTVAPAGLAVPAALGTPTVNQIVPPSFACSPAGIAVPVTVGNPTLTQAAPPDEGNWNSLFNAINTARAEHERNAERRRHPVECPEHFWPLEQVDGVLHCKFGGHIVRPC
jgi:hypothetical protein